VDLITLHEDKTPNEGSSSSHEDFAQKYSDYLSSNSEAYLTQLLREHQNTSEKIKDDALLDQFKKAYTTEYATTTLTQTLLLTQRSLTNLARHPTIFQASAFIHIVFALVIGSLFSGLKDRPEMGATSFNKSIALFFITSFLATMTFSAMPQCKLSIGGSWCRGDRLFPCCTCSNLPFSLTLSNNSHYRA
jgi:hypothetical protein